MTARIAMVLTAALALGMGGILVADEVPRFEPEDGITEPEVIEKVNPVYPEDARDEKVQGSVVLDVVVEADGTIGDVLVVEDPDPRLSHAATAAVLQWRFKPARDAEGQPVAVRYYLTIRFRLE